MKNYIGWLNESLEKKYFKEDLQNDKRKYTELASERVRLTPEEFDLCCNADPTYKEGSNKRGTYLDWIINTYNRFKKDNPADTFRFQHCTDLLNNWEKKKTHVAPGCSSDISQFKTLDDLREYLSDMDNFTFDDAEAGEDFHSVDLNDPKNATKFYENSRCTVWVPHNYAASVKLGRGAKWCTAYSDDRSYYDDYTDRAPLYVVIMKDDPEEKYQLFFDPDNSVDDQYMDRDDRPIHEADLPEIQTIRAKHNGEEDKKRCGQLDQFFDKWKREADMGYYRGLSQARILIYKLHSNALSKAYHEEYDEVALRLLRGLISGEAQGMVLDYYNLSTTLFGIQDDKCRAEGRKLIDEYLYRSSDLENKMSGDLHNLSFKELTDLGAQLHRLSKSAMRSDWAEKYDSAALDYFYSHASGGLVDDSVALHPEESTGLIKSLFAPVHLEIPNTVTKIDADAFMGFNTISSLVIPSSVTGIGHGAFCICSNLTSIVFKGGVPYIGEEAFRGCGLSGTLNFPEGTKRICKRAFMNNTLMSAVKFPVSLKIVGDDAFWFCQIKDVYYAGSEDDRAAIEFGKCNETLLAATWHYNCKDGEEQ